MSVCTHEHHHPPREISDLKLFLSEKNGESCAKFIHLADRAHEKFLFVIKQEVRPAGRREDDCDRRHFLPHFSLC